MPPPRGRSRRRVLVLVTALVAGLLLLTGVALIAVDLARPEPVDVRGALQLSTTGVLADGTSCTGTNWYADIAPGRSVVLRDASGELLAATALTGGVWSATNGWRGTCSFRFEFADVALARDGAALYTITVGTSALRGDVPYTGDQLRGGPVLTLGG